MKMVNIDCLDIEHEYCQLRQGRSSASEIPQMWMSHDLNTKAPRTPSLSNSRIWSQGGDMKHQAHDLHTHRDSQDETAIAIPHTTSLKRANPVRRRGGRGARNSTIVADDAREGKRTS